MRLRVVVAFGGESVEHEISIISAHQVMAAMDVLRYEIIPLYIAKDGSFYTGDKLLELSSFKSIEPLVQACTKITLLHRQQNFYLVPLKHTILTKEKAFDMVFPVLHGTHGEDGIFQGYLTMLKIPYVGCNVLGGAIGQDKIIMKQVLEDSGLPITPWYFWTQSKTLNDAFYRKAERLGYPLIVKPANLGSSIGICIVHNEVELYQAMKSAYLYDPRVVIEKAISQLIEINCSVLGDEEYCRVSALEEVMKTDGILSYQDKYVGKNQTKGMANTSRKIPANIDNDLKEELQLLAKETFIALNATGVSRIDFLMNAETKDVYINEINTIPGSLSFYLWQASGLSFCSLVDELVEIAKKQVRRQQQRITSYDSNILSTYGIGSKCIK
ncbi:MAG: D-alanine--D-alanine ligase family protein [Longicatena sp.]